MASFARISKDFGCFSINGDGNDRRLLREPIIFFSVGYLHRRIVNLGVRFLRLTITSKLGLAGGGVESEMKRKKILTSFFFAEIVVYA